MKSQKSQGLVLALLCLCLSLTVVACAKIDVTTTINADGSGDNLILVGLDTRRVGQGNILWTSLDMNVQEIVKAGAQKQDWQDGRYQGYKLTQKFRNLDEMPKLLV